LFYRTLASGCREDEFRWQLRAARRLKGHHSFGFLGSSLPAHRSVVTAIACFTTSPASYEQAVTRAISLGDDTDTLAAMAGALCGAHLGVQAIPARWIEYLEGGPKGVAFLRTLAERLHDHYLESTKGVGQPGSERNPE
jgi:poly(ADP-ribose) glycohydrolase ARH3